MKIDREPDEVIEHRPIQCEGCPHAGICKLRCCETRYEYEAVVETKLIAHKVLGCKACALTGEAAQGTFPRHITGAKQYGPGVAGLAVSLLTIGYMSVDRVQKLLKSLLDHAMCCAHLERELVYAHETGNQAWAKLLRELLQTLCHRRKVLQSEGKEAFPEQELAGYLERYDELVDEGLAANPIPERAPGKRGRRAKGKFRCLLERFRDFKDDILRFKRDWRVPYTNNTAEIAAKPPATGDSLRKGQGEGFRVLPHQIRRR